MNINKDEHDFYSHLKSEMAIRDNSTQHSAIREKDSIKTINVETISSYMHLICSVLYVQMQEIQLY